MLEERYVLIIVGSVLILFVFGILAVSVIYSRATPYILSITNDFYNVTEDVLIESVDVTRVFFGVIDDYSSNDVAISFNRGASFVHYKLSDKEVATYIHTGSDILDLYLYKHDGQLIINISKQNSLVDDDIDEWKMFPNQIDFKVYSNKNKISTWNANNIEIKHQDVLNVHIGFVQDEI
jgi:hypothetical protein